MTGQDTYKKFINEQISPVLRSLGFSGSAGTYQMPNDKAYILIGFQKSKWSTKEVVKFTVNVSVISRKVWEDAVNRGLVSDKMPSAVVGYLVDLWSRRLSQITFLGSFRDKWWKITASTDLETTAEDILRRIKKHALPAITKQLNKLD